MRTRQGRSMASSCRPQGYTSTVCALRQQRCIFSRLFRSVRAIVSLASTVHHSWGLYLGPLELISEQLLLTTEPAHPITQGVCGNFDNPVMRAVMPRVTCGRNRCSQLEISKNSSRLSLPFHVHQDWLGVRFYCLSQLPSQFQRSSLSPDS
jgi:hypothetical protein